MADAEPQKALDRAKYFIFVTQVHFCSMYAVVAWDWITSLRRERRHIWKAQWTSGKGLYLFCRYWVLILMPYLLWCFTVDHSFNTCQHIFQSAIGIATCNQVAVEGILILRTYAFFSRNKYVLTCLLAMLAGVLSYQLDVIIQHMLPLPFVGSNEGPCFPTSRPGEAHILGYFVAPLAFDTITTVMTIGRALFMHKRHGGSSQIVQVFLREGLFYYILISAANLINGIFNFQPKKEMSAVMIPLTIMLGPILACRLFLDIRERATELPITSSVSGASNGGRHPAVEFGKQRNNYSNHRAVSYDAGHTGLATEIELDDVHDTLDSKIGTEDIDSYGTYALSKSGGIRVDIQHGVEVR